MFRAETLPVVEVVAAVDGGMDLVVVVEGEAVEDMEEVDMGLTAAVVAVVEEEEDIGVEKEAVVTAEVVVVMVVAVAVADHVTIVVSRVILHGIATIAVVEVEAEAVEADLEAAAEEGMAAAAAAVAVVEDATTVARLGISQESALLDRSESLSILLYAFFAFGSLD